MTTSTNPPTVQNAGDTRAVIYNIIVFFPFAAIFMFALLRALSWEQYVVVVHEDGIVEYTTAVVYLLATIIAVLIALDLRKSGEKFLSWCCALGAAGFAFIMLEEISWGQRIFDVATPGRIRALNAQREMNFHNLKPVQNILHFIYITVSAWCIFGRYLIPKSLSNEHSVFFRLAAPRGVAVLYFVPVFVFYSWWEFVRPTLMTYDIIVAHWRDQEPVELLMACGFLVHIAMNHKTLGLKLHREQN